MVITPTISVHYRLHCVRINALRAFGIHALNAFLSYDIVCEVRQPLEVSHNTIVTVGNNINRRDDTAITSARALFGRERCTFHYEMELPLYYGN